MYTVTKAKHWQELDESNQQIQYEQEKKIINREECALLYRASLLVPKIRVEHMSIITNYTVDLPNT